MKFITMNKISTVKETKINVAQSNKPKNILETIVGVMLITILL